MSQFQSIIPLIRSFLCHELGSLSLPPPVESKRQTLIEQIDILSLGPTPSIPIITASPAPVVQRRPLSSVVRLFSSSRKRYSLPASISYAAQASKADEPPLPVRSNNLTCARGSRLEHDYEVPKTLATHGASEPTRSVGQVEVRRRPFTRHSLSPQLEIVQSNRSSVQFLESSAYPFPTLTPDSQDDTALTLPKKCLNSQARRFSAFIDPSWTLAGSLHHRFKPNKWTRLNMCLLTGGSRLVAYKSSHALNPTLVVFLCGSTGIFAGRDSGMDFVIKIAHPTRGTTVLAADTEEQALVWIKQINQYAQGITPLETQSFLDHSTLPNPNMLQNIGSIPSVSAMPNTSVFAISADQVDSLKQTNKVETQEDSGFSAPVSSGSEGNSGDGVVRLEKVQPSSSGVITSHCLSSPAVLRFPNSTCSTNVATDCGFQSNLHGPGFSLDRSSVKCSVPNTSTFSDVSRRSTLYGSIRSSLRREGLLSSMRRKMESFSSKRHARKSLSKSSEKHSWTTLKSADGDHPLDPVLNTNCSDHRPFTLHPSVAASDVFGFTGVASGFDWSQLESACSLFLRPPSQLGDAFSVSVPTTDVHQSMTSCISERSHLSHLLRRVSPQHPTEGKTGHGERLLVCGEAYIAIPGRVSWTSRWCSLRSHCLDIYPTIDPPHIVANNSSIGHSHHWPLFSLTLGPGLVELGLAGDKRHKAALRLAVPKHSSVSLLFDAPDKVQMGSWIRGFIEALGIISPTNTYHLDSASYAANPVNQRGRTHSCGSTDAQYDVPELVYSDTYSGLTKSSHCSCAKHCALTNNTTEDISSPLGSMSIYDEVCSSQYNGSVHNDCDLRYKRHWRTPSLPVTLTTPSHRCAVGSRNQTSFNGNSINMCRANPTRSHHWYVPPPSTRLLAQPLPPLPSMGPSGSESLAGTIDSSHASSSLTPDECADFHDDATDFEPGVTDLVHPSTPHMSASCLRRHLRTRSSQTPSSPNVGSDADRPNQRRHSSLNIWDRQDVLNGTSPPTDDSTNPTAPASVVDAELRTTHTDYNLFADSKNNSRSCGTSTIHVDFSSDPSLPTFEDRDGSIWNSHIPSLEWSDDLQEMRPVYAVAPRRSVSCVDGKKPPPIANTDCRVVATLPHRHESGSILENCVNQQAFLDDLPVRETLLSMYSSNTATSSGVALTIGSFSSPGSGETTRPRSMSISWPVQPVLTKDDDLFEINSTTANAITCRAMFFAHSALPQPVAHPGKSDTLPPPSRAHVHPSLKRAETVTASDEKTIRASLRGLAEAHCHSTSNLNYSPTNASLVLVATQLEEVQHGAKRLRSRHDALSFRLTSRLAREQKCGVGEGTEINTMATSHHTDPHSLPVVGIEPLSHKSAPYDDKPESEEATESLCARLSAIEILIQQAESMELMLRTAMNKYMSSNSKTSETDVANVQRSRDRQTIPGEWKREQPMRSNLPQTPTTDARPSPRSRGRGGRSRRRRYGGHNPRGGGMRPRGQSWAKSSTPSQCAVAITPAV